MVFVLMYAATKPLGVGLPVTGCMVVAGQSSESSWQSRPAMTSTQDATMYMSSNLSYYIVTVP